MILIPAIHEYAVHYETMLRQAGIKNYRVYLNEIDRQFLRRNFHSATSKIVKQIDAPIDSVILGYDYAFEDIVKQIDAFTLVEKRQIESIINGIDVHATYMVLKHEQFPDKLYRLALIGSNQVLWGEASVHIVEGMVQASPNSKDVIFLGSAGSPGTDILYGMSLPQNFQRRDMSYIPIQNILATQYFGTHPTVQKETVGGVEISRIDITTHGFSYSPAEQTREFVSEHYLQGGGAERIFSVAGLHSYRLYLMKSPYWKPFGQVRFQILVNYFTN